MKTEERSFNDTENKGRDAVICPQCIGKGQVTLGGAVLVCGLCRGAGCILKETDKDEPQLLLD